MRRATTILLVAGCALPCAGVAHARGGARPRAHHRDVRLSNERTFTRWATPLHRAAIRRAPRKTAGRVARLRLVTEDGFPEVYLALRSHRDRQGRRWVRVRIPMRPNGRVGWVRRGALGRLHLRRDLIVVDRRRLRIRLFRRGRRVWSAPVGVGKPGTPTPAGRFWVRERLKVADRSSGYWPYALGTADYSTLSEWPGGGVVGIHGPFGNDAGIPGRISHGCIRLHPADMAWLARHTGVGTPLRIR